MLAVGGNREVAELPAGTITLLFSDIESSMALPRRPGHRVTGTPRRSWRNVP